LLELVLPEGARVQTKGDAVEFSLHRPALQVRVTVPVTALEWFVEASDRSSGARVEDWCDYEGYDTSSNEQLDRDMADDVGKFLEQLLRSELRMAKLGASKVVLEWKIGEVWEQAVPLLPDAV
jgi:hypothetical protein